MKMKILHAFQILLALIGVAWSIIAFRKLSLILVIFAVILSVLPKLKNKQAFALATIAIAALSPFQPYDISFHSWEGPPKFVPYITGLQRDKEAMLKKQENGELVLGSDVVSGFEPKLVLIW